jgi:hypothetical protein
VGGATPFLFRPSTGPFGSHPDASFLRAIQQLFVAQPNFTGISQLTIHRANLCEIAEMRVGPLDRHTIALVKCRVKQPMRQKLNPEPPPHLVGEVLNKTEAEVGREPHVPRPLGEGRGCEVCQCADCLAYAERYRACFNRIWRDLYSEKYGEIVLR